MLTLGRELDEVELFDFFRLGNVRRQVRVLIVSCMSVLNAKLTMKVSKLGRHQTERHSLTNQS